jgi:hypothetical protein
VLVEPAHISLITKGLTLPAFVINRNLGDTARQHLDTFRGLILDDGLLKLVYEVTIRGQGASSNMEIDANVGVVVGIGGTRALWRCVGIIHCQVYEAAVSYSLLGYTQPEFSIQPMGIPPG